MKKYFLFLIIIIILLITIFIVFTKRSDNVQNKSQAQQNSDPQIISTNPNPLDNATILPTQTIEITFNQPLQNIPEVRYDLEPKADIKLDLSSDRLTLKIIPQKPFDLGTTYTLFIQPGTKLDKGTFGKEAIYHFKTIDFKAG